MAVPAQATSRFRFSLQWLFAAMTAAAVCALVYRATGRDEAIGIAGAYVLLALGWRFRTHGIIKWMAFALAGVAVWFSSVDYSWTVEHCRHCPSHWDVVEIRVLHHAVWSWQGPDHCPFHARVFEDLGSPCRHEVERWQKWRLWGLIWPRQFHNGTCCLSGDAEWYSQEVRLRVQELGRNEPQLGEELRQAIRSQNWPVRKAIFARIRAEAVVATTMP